MNRGATGLLLFAHGARDPAWGAPFEAVRCRCAAAEPQRPVALAFLEFMSPDILQAGAALAAQGCTVVDVVPLFLGVGGHVRKDIPRLLSALGVAHPGVRWRLCRSIGEDAQVIAAMAAAARAPAPLQEDDPR